MSAPKRTQPRAGSSFLERQQLGSLETVRKRILQAGTTIPQQAFDTLVKANCDPGFLLIFFANAIEEGPALDTWQARFGVTDRRELESVLKRLRRAANEFEKLDKAGLLKLAAWPKFSNQFTPAQFHDLVNTIPNVLRESADSIGLAANGASFKQRAHGFSNTALAQLVAYVEHCTGAPHDTEVSALLDALGKTGKNGDAYTPDALKTWRAEHAHMISDCALMCPSMFGR